MCTPSSCGITFQQKNISPPASTKPYSRALAKPCHNSHLLPALHSVANSPNARKEEECSSYDPGFCYSTPFGTCSYAKKGDILCTSNPKSIVPTDHATKVYGFYTLAVCTTDLDYSPELAWCPPPFQPTSKGRSH